MKKLFIALAFTFTGQALAVNKCQTIADVYVTDIKKNRSQMRPLIKAPVHSYIINAPKEMQEKFTRDMRVKFGHEFDIDMLFFYKATVDGCDIKIDYDHTSKSCILVADDTLMIKQNAKECSLRLRECLVKSGLTLRSPQDQLAKKQKECVKSISLCQSFDPGRKIDVKYCAQVYRKKDSFK